MLYALDHDEALPGPKTLTNGHRWLYRLDRAVSQALAERGIEDASFGRGDPDRDSAWDCPSTPIGPRGYYDAGGSAFPEDQYFIDEYMILTRLEAGTESPAGNEPDEAAHTYRGDRSPTRLSDPIGPLAADRTHWFSYISKSPDKSMNSPHGRRGLRASGVILGLSGRAAQASCCVALLRRCVHRLHRAPCLTPARRAPTGQSSRQML